MPTRRAAALRATSLLTADTPVSRSSRHPSPPPISHSAGPPLALSAADPQTCPPELYHLRRNWKWAVISQWLITFFPLINMDDVTVVVVEEDLVYGRVSVLSRIMHRLVVALSQDRKLTIDTWQTGLRKQYFRRGFETCPLGPEPKRPTPSPSPEPDDGDEEGDEAKLEKGDDGEKELLNPSHPDGPKPIEEKTEPVDSSSSNVEEGTKIESRILAGGAIEEGGAPEMEEQPSIDWADLSLDEKLDSLYQVIDWLFQSPLRLRQAMRSDDETASWRIEPIGFDSQHNSYWFLGGDRLWINRHPPKPPRKATKRKAAPKKSPAKRPAASSDDEVEEPAPKRIKTSIPSRPSRPTRGSASNNRSTRQTPNNNKASVNGKGKQPEIATPAATGRGTRAAKLQANVKLDQQAKELAALQREARTFANGRNARASGAATTPTAKPVVVGTRISARLRGPAKDEDGQEWQEIPEEWLVESSPDKGQGKSAMRRGRSVRNLRAEAHDDHPAGLDEEEEEEEEEKADLDGLLTESAAMSELTELTDVEDEEEDEDSNPVAQLKKVTAASINGKASVSVEPSEVKEEEVEEPPPMPPNFVEWECIAVTLEEWEEVAEPFSSSKNYLEKALYKVLTTDVVPFVIETLKEAEKKRRVEEAMISRKRSSRIAFKESEKVEAMAAAKRKMEENEKMARERRMHARHQKEEELRLKRETDREQRRREREERELKRQLGPPSSPKIDVVTEEALPELPEPSSTAKGRGRVPRKPAVKATKPNGTASRKANGKKTGTRTPAGDDWELDCEVCSAQGVNKDGNLPLVCCSRCFKWQHIRCHDRADQQAGRPARNWDVEDFTCQRCQRKLKASSSKKPATQQPLYTTVPTARGQVQPGPQLYPVDPRGLYQQPYYTMPPLKSGITAYGATPQQKVLPMQLVPKHHPSLENGSGYSHAGSVAGPSTPSSSQHRNQSQVQFAHYQPEHRGFSPAAAAYPQHGYSQQHHHSVPNPYPQQSRQQYANPPSRSSLSGAHVSDANGAQYGHVQDQRRQSQTPNYSDVRANPAAYVSPHHMPYGGFVSTPSHSNSTIHNKELHPSSSTNSPAPGVPLNNQGPPQIPAFAAVAQTQFQQPQQRSGAGASAGTHLQHYPNQYTNYNPQYHSGQSGQQHAQRYYLQPQQPEQRPHM